MAWGGLDHLCTPRDSVLRKDSRRNYHFFCSTMGKSSTLHCEVQLLDDQSTVLDLDVSFFYFVNNYFGCKMVDIYNVSLYAAMSLMFSILSLPIVCDPVLSFCGYEVQNENAKFYRVYKSYGESCRKIPCDESKFFSILR